MFVFSSALHGLTTLIRSPKSEHAGSVDSPSCKSARAVHHDPHEASLSLHDHHEHLIGPVRLRHRVRFPLVPPPPPLNRHFRPTAQSAPSPPCRNSRLNSASSPILSAESSSRPFSFLAPSLASSLEVCRTASQGSARSRSGVPSLRLGARFRAEVIDWECCCLGGVWRGQARCTFGDSRL